MQNVTEAGPSAAHASSSTATCVNPSHEPPKTNITESKDGEEKILVDKDTEYYNFTPGTRADLKPGATIFTGARVGDDGKFMAQRVSVSKDGVNPPQ